jgi:hypothetical protein
VLLSQLTEGSSSLIGDGHANKNHTLLLSGLRRPGREVLQPDDKNEQASQ